MSTTKTKAAKAPAAAPAAAPAPNVAAALVSVTLARAHTHAGKDYEPGDTLDVDPPTAQWLQHHGVTQAPDTATATAAVAEQA